MNEYEVEITLPSDYLVWATGEQQNEEEVYSKAILKRINKSKESDELMKIVEKEDWEKGPVSGEGKKTWKFNSKERRKWRPSEHWQAVWPTI